MNYTQNGSYMALAGLVVAILAKFSVNVTAEEILQIAGAVVSIVGIVKQAIAHKKFASAAASAGYAVKGM